MNLFKEKGSLGWLGSSGSLCMSALSDPSRPLSSLSILPIRRLRGVGMHDFGDTMYHPKLTQVPIFLRTPKFSPSDASESLN